MHACRQAGRQAGRQPGRLAGWLAGWQAGKTDRQAYIAVLVQTARPFSPQIGTFETSASRMIGRITQLSVSRSYHRGILHLLDITAVVS